MTVRPRRLLFVANVGWFFLSHRLPIAIAARDAGYDVHVASDFESAGEVAAIRSKGLTFHRIRVQRGRRSIVADLRLVLQLARLYALLRPDIVHHVTVKPVIYGGIAARLTGIRNVVSAISGLGYAFTDGAGSRVMTRVLIMALYKVALRGRRRKVIFQNSDDMDAFTSAGLVSSDASVLIEGSGVDLTEFRSTPEPEGPVNIVLPARVLRDKGILEFVQAASTLKRQGIDARFLIAGRLDPDNPAAIGRAEFESRCRDAGVVWLGHVGNMPELLTRSHIVCLPSYREGLSKTLIEACAAGRAIVATDVTGCRDVARNGINALTVPPRDATALADAIRTLATQASMRRRFGAAGRQLAESTYDVKIVIDRTLGLYESLVPDIKAGT